MTQAACGCWARVCHESFIAAKANLDDDEQSISYFTWAYRYAQCTFTPLKAAQVCLKSGGGDFFVHHSISAITGLPRWVCPSGFRSAHTPNLLQTQVEDIDPAGWLSSGEEHSEGEDREEDNEGED